MIGTWIRIRLLSVSKVNFAVQPLLAARQLRTECKMRTYNGYFDQNNFTIDD